MLTSCLRIRRILGKDSKEPPYIAIHEISPHFKFTKQFDINTFRGLLYCQLIAGKNKQLLLSCWATENTYLAQRQHFLQYTQHIEASSEQNGFYLELKTAEPPWFKRVSVMSTILAITTLLGAYGTFQGQFRQWFAQPEIAIFASPFGNTINLSIGPRQTIHFAVKNVNDWSSEGVEFTDFEISDADGKPSTNVRLEGVIDTNFPSLGIGETREFSLPMEASRRGRYLLTIATRTKAGEFVPRKLHEHPLQLYVWPNRDILAPQNIRFTNNVCTADVPIITGIDYDDGLYCEALLTNVPGVEFFAADPCIGDPLIQSINRLGKATALLSWHTGKLLQMSRSITTLYLQSAKPIQGTEWSNIIHQIQFSFR